MSKLIVLAKRGSVRQITIQGAVTLIGRDPACAIHLDSSAVSRHHAAIRWTGDRFVICDTSSRNGTFVNQARIKELPLRNHDAISIGDCQLRFLYTTRDLPADEALRLVTMIDTLGNLDAVRGRSDWAAFFRRTGAARHH